MNTGGMLISMHFQKSNHWSYDEVIPLLFWYWSCCQHVLEDWKAKTSIMFPRMNHMMFVLLGIRKQCWIRSVEPEIQVRTNLWSSNWSEVKDWYLGWIWTISFSYGLMCIMDKNSNLEFSRISQFFVKLDLIQTKLTNSLNELWTRHPSISSLVWSQRLTPRTPRLTVRIRSTISW